MGLNSIKCSACGGTVAMLAGQEMPICLFCGSDAVEESSDELIEQPDSFLSFGLPSDEAKGLFKRFAKSSWFHPKELKNAVVNLKELLVPAWVFSGSVESHWSALVPASSKSGKKPLTGANTLNIEEVLVLSGSKLTHAELNALAPFDTKDEVEFDAENIALPFELAQLTRSLAEVQVKNTLVVEHENQIRSQINAKELNLSSLFHDLEGRPLLLPIYICSYRYKDTSYRLVINGQTGEFYGVGPKSLKKLLLVFGLSLAALGAALHIVQNYT